MSRDWSPKELFYADRELKLRQNTITWTIGDKSFQDSYQMRLDSNERYKNCPEMFFLGEAVVKELVKRGVDDSFLKELEETIKGIEKETVIKDLKEAVEGIEEKINIPHTEMYDIAHSWFENEMRSYYREPNDEEFMEKLSELYVRLKAKEKVQSYLEESYDTIEEIR